MVPEGRANVGDHGFEGSRVLAQIVRILKKILIVMIMMIVSVNMI